jgi:hypothetical protein
MWWMRARGVRLNSRTARSDAISRPAAPSEIVDELPAVSLPPGVKPLRVASFSRFVSARGLSSSARPKNSVIPRSKRPFYCA